MPFRRHRQHTLERRRPDHLHAQEVGANALGHDEKLDPSRTSLLIPFGQNVTLDGAVGAQITARWFTGDQFRNLAYLDPAQHSNQGLGGSSISRMPFCFSSSLAITRMLELWNWWS